jgi:nucleoside-diphosphate-sugar epimerase
MENASSQASSQVASAGLPPVVENESQLEEVMTTPTPALVQSVKGLGGDVILLGVAGKMGPTLARLVRRTLDAAQITARVIGVARFSDPAARRKLDEAGVETISADLLEAGVLEGLPDVPNVVYLVGRKFGATGNPALTWAVNTWLPARVAERYRQARIVALSTGNVYPLVPVSERGASESHPTGPIGEYAQSCLGRERMLEFMSERYGTRGAIIRLNYAIDLRYGVLLDLARKVWNGETIDVTMGHVNVIWQGDANAAILRAFEWCASPPFVLNLTGPEVASVRWLAEELGKRLDRPPVFRGLEASTALLSDASRSIELLGLPRVNLPRMIDWVAHWVKIGGPTLDKPTHFETRDGAF